MPNKIKISDLKNNYKSKIENYETMISLLDEDMKKIFESAINLFDVRIRQNHFDSYVAYALKSLLIKGHYYDVSENKWKTCIPKSKYESEHQPTDDNTDPYLRYIRTIYNYETNDLSDSIGVSNWSIIESNVNTYELDKVIAGEMFYGEFGLNFDVAGEQKKQSINNKEDKNKTQQTNELQIPDIPISENIDISELAKDDTSDEKFIYAYTDSGISKNRRNWKPIIMERIAEQVMLNNPPGNMGHVNPKDIGYQLPLPVVTWIGAVTEQLPNDEKRLWLKGYVIPTDDGNKLKTFIRAKAINSISVYGGLTLLPNEDSDIQDVLDVDLKSIDISGKLKEGLNSSIVKLAGEMNILEKENNQMADYSNLTLSGIKQNNPKLFADMRRELVDQMNIENEQKIIMSKAGEMDTLVSTLKTDNVVSTVSDMVKFGGEMADILSIPHEANILPNMSEIMSKVKELVSDLVSVTNALKPAENQTVVEKANEIAVANKLAENTKAIDDVNNKFNELTSTINNEAIKNLVAMQFNDLLKADPQNISDTYSTDAIARLENEVPTVMNSVVENAKSIMEQGINAGEMALFDNLGVANSGTSNNKKKTEELDDLEYAKSLGYNF